MTAAGHDVTPTVPGLLVTECVLGASESAHATNVTSAWLDRDGRKFCHRSLVARYGYDYQPERFWLGAIPSFFADLADRLGVRSNSVSLALYEPRDDIAPHIDLPCWDDIAIFNLGGPAEIVFEQGSKRVPVKLASGDLIKLTGDSLRLWKHSVFAERKRYSIVFRYRSDV